MQQLPVTLQQLGQDYENGTLNLRQAMGAATAEVGADIHGMQDRAYHEIRNLARDFRTEAIALTRPEGPLAGPMGPTGPLLPELAIARALATDPTQPVPHNVVAASSSAVPERSAQVQQEPFAAERSAQVQQEPFATPETDD
ncbi:hypothetical protein KO481_42595 [Nocardia sp. NEAU-G5]|uniref:PE domain-containing protein n=1 Tax=Nocardia albiluteola TaxID=2842303 RepID=A0ABS6BG58_9NOCA|nr:hypothetical protein [Nocardia albiluteola]